MPRSLLKRYSKRTVGAFLWKPVDVPNRVENLLEEGFGDTRQKSALEQPQPPVKVSRSPVCPPILLH